MAITSEVLRTIVQLVNDQTGEPQPWAIGMGPKRKRLYEYLTSLSRTDQVELLAIMYVGRDDFATGYDAHKQADHSHNAGTVDYLIEKPELARYLEEGWPRFLASPSTPYTPEEEIVF